MRKYTIIVLMILFTALSYAQVGINTNTPDDSSALEIKSTSGGLLIPRMTVDQRDTISSPSEGLMIYQLNGTVGFYFYDGTAWTKIDGVAGTPGTNGSDGASAYTVWLAAGNTGTETEFLTALIGQQGQQGESGPEGAPGTDGTNGSDGASAYAVWLAAGNTGTETEFLTALIGQQGQQGVVGTTGAPGTNGTNGSDGASAYAVWLAAGNTGTETEFLTALIGQQGQQGESGPEGLNALIKTVDEPAGENCENGGLKIEVGIDSNINGVLDNEEIDLNQTQFICNMSSNANSISHGSHTFTESDSFVVPDGVNTVFFEFLGASGGDGADLTFNACNPNNTWPSRGDGGDSGTGVKVTGMIIVESGDVLTFTVGVNGLDMPTEDVCASNAYVTKYASDGTKGSLSNLSVNNNELLNFTAGYGGMGGFMTGNGSGPQDGQSGSNGFHTLGNLYSNYGIIILSS
ncbi:hypothetical protein N9J10_03635, partial [Flavobacteriaceae bacterium]|nr:hypothetical protein [Flavobacteriaceae bacterium]